eukprot:Amastigsp_a846093_34.p1 type:complete len:168 gc:universal Amastigsp_a846093_34:448-951(+)
MRTRRGRLLSMPSNRSRPLRQLLPPSAVAMSRALTTMTTMTPAKSPRGKGSKQRPLPHPNVRLPSSIEQRVRPIRCRCTSRQFNMTTYATATVTRVQPYPRSANCSNPSQSCTSAKSRWASPPRSPKGCSTRTHRTFPLSSALSTSCDPSWFRWLRVSATPPRQNSS